jgi:hypothetical protein
MIALLLLLQQVPNGGFESGTLDGCTLLENCAGSVVGGVGSLPPPEGQNMALIEQVGGGVGTIGGFTIGVVRTLVSVPAAGDYVVSAQTRVVSDMLPAADMTLTMEVLGAGAPLQSSVAIVPADFSPITVPDSIFALSTAVIPLSTAITVGGPTLLDITFTLTRQGPDTAMPAMILDDIRVDAAGVGPAFSACVAHLGGGFASFRNPAVATDPNDGALHGSIVELHTGSFTFDSFG